MTLEVLNYGGTITKLLVPSKTGEFINVVAGLENTRDYTASSYHGASLSLGASIGRYAGRLSKGSFEINKESFPLYNDQGVHLHGGKQGFDKRIWRIESIVRDDEPAVTLTYLSKHLEEGYPGNLLVRATYKLLKNNILNIVYEAQSDRNTYVNLTNHSYYNLDGQGTILNHRLKLNCSQYLETDARLIPTGRLMKVQNSRFDFKTESKIGRSDFKGFDDCFVYDNTYPNIATLVSEKSGVSMEVITNQPAVVIYTPKEFPDLNFKNPGRFSLYPTICFETQNFPDAPNHNSFPPALLLPGQTYRNESEFKFSVVS
jgi:aldose 1-epimerase